MTSGPTIATWIAGAYDGLPWAYRIAISIWMLAGAGIFAASLVWVRDKRAMKRPPGSPLTDVELSRADEWLNGPSKLESAIFMMAGKLFWVFIGFGAAWIFFNLRL